MHKISTQLHNIRPWVVLSWIIIIGAILRIIYLWVLIDAPDFIALRQDLDVQDYQARAMLSGDWKVREGVPDPHIPTTPYYRPPGYPYFLAVIYWISDGSYLAPRLIHFLLGIIHIILIYILGKMLFNTITGLCSAFLVSIYWAFVYYEGEVNDPALFVFLVPCILISLYFSTQKNSILLTFIAGLLIGIYSIMRPNILLYTPFVIIWLGLKYIKQNRWTLFLLHTFFLILAILTIITPVTVRNYLVSGEFVPISTYFGENLLIGNSKDSDGVTPWLPYLQELEGTGNWSVWHYDNVVKGLGKELGRKVTHSEASRIFTKMALQYIVTHPWETTKLTLKKAILFWSPMEITENKVVEGERQHYIPLKYLPRFSFLLGTLIFGLAWLLRDKGINYLIPSPKKLNDHQSLHILIAMFILSYYISFLPFFVNARARVPLLGLLLLYGGYGVSKILLYLTNKEYLKFLFSCGVLMLLILLCRIEIIPYKPDMCRWHYDRADSFLRVGRIEEAKKEAESLISLPERPMTYMPFRLGHTFAKLNEPQLAVTLLRLALSPDPNEQNPMYREDIHYHIGAQLMKLGELDEAKNEFLRALEINPKDPRVLNDLGLIYRQKNDLDKAEQYFKLAIEAKNNFSLPFINLVELYLIQNRFDESKTLLENSIKENPENVELSYNLAYVYHYFNYLSEAEKYYQKVLNLEPKHPSALNNIGVLYLTIGNIKSSDFYLKLCIDKNPHFTLAFLNYGDLLFQLGRYDESIFYYYKGLETNPNNVELILALTNLQMTLQKFDNAKCELLDGLNRLPNNKELLFTLGKLYKDMQDYSSARDTFEGLLKLDKNNIDVYVHLAEIHTKMGNVQKSKEIIELLKTISNVDNQKNEQISTSKQ